MIVTIVQTAAAEVPDNSAHALEPEMTNRTLAAILRHFQAPKNAKFRGLYRETNPARPGATCSDMTVGDKSGHLPAFQPFIRDSKTIDALSRRRPTSASHNWTSSTRPSIAAPAAA